jgi:hypothetical protein
MVTNIEKVILYASQSLKEFEKNYTPYLLKLAAAVWAIDNYHVYLYSRRFTLLTDHHPVKKMLRLHQKTLNRLQQQMLKYNFIVLYQKGEENGGPAALSRNPVDSVATEPADLIKLQAQDKFMRQIIDYLTDKWLLREHIFN